MKRLVIIILLVLAFVVAVVLATPLILKPKLRSVATNSLKKYFNGQVEVADVKVSVWKDFPNMDIEWTGILVKGAGPQQNDTLLWIGAVRTNTSIRAVFLPSDIEIAKLEVDGARLNLNEKSFAKRQRQNTRQISAASLMAGGNKAARLKLEQMLLSNATLKYTNENSGVIFDLNGISAELAGEMFGKQSNLDLRFQVEKLNITQQERQFLSTGNLSFQTQLETDFGEKTYHLKNGQIDWNEIPIQVNGTIAAPADSVYFDLDLDGKETGFGNFLALFPNIKEKLLKDFTTQGKTEMKGTVSGYYFENEYPSVEFTTTISDASLQYPGMPGSIDKLHADLVLSKPQGSFDTSIIRIADAHAELGKNPIDFGLEITHPVSDPAFGGIFIGKINLTDLQNIFPLENALLYGDVDANLRVKGKYSDLLAEDYSKIQSDGEVWLHNVQYSSPKLTQRISVSEAKLDFSPQQVGLQRMVLQIGQSDFLLKGKVKNYLDYLLKEGTLEADLQLDSRFVNLNQLFQLMNHEANLSASIQNGPSGTDENITAFDVPSRVKLRFRSNIEHALLVQIPMEKIRGNILVENQKLTLQGLGMNLLEGSAKMNGSYANTEQNQPRFDFEIDLEDFDIPTMARTSGAFRKLVPGSENSTGRLSAELQIKGSFDEKLNLVSGSASGAGTFGTKNLVVVNSPLFSQLGGIIQKEKLQRVNVDDFTAQLQIEKGNVHLLPFETRVIGQPTKVVGNLSSKNMLDMRLDFVVDRAIIGSDIQKILAVIPGNEKIKQLPATVTVDGPTASPKVHPDLSVTARAVADATKDDLKNSLDKLGKGIFKLLK